MRNKRRDRDTEETAGEDEGRDGRDVVTRDAWGSRDAWSPQKLEPPEGGWHWDTLISDVWSPGLRDDTFLLF